MQVQLTQAQAFALSDLLTRLTDSEGVLLTAQSGGDVYASFGTGGFTITADGTVTEEDFG